MRLEIDAGNTFIKWRMVDKGQLWQSGRVPTACDATVELGAIFSSMRVSVDQGVFIGSVASSEVNESLGFKIQKAFAVDPVFVHTQRQAAGVVNSYIEPERMGVDRWLAILAAYHQCGKSAVTVVDCGSAITVDYVAENGHHLGGYILPGINLMRESLLQGTAKIDYSNQETRQTCKPGRTTREAVENGADYLFAALGEKLLREAELSGHRLVFTGGDGAILYDQIGCGELQPDLVLDGLAWCSGYA